LNDIDIEYLEYRVILGMHNTVYVISDIRRFC